MCIEEGARGPLWDLSLGAHSPLGTWGALGIQKCIVFVVGYDFPFDTMSNNSLRPQGWPGLDVSLGWLPTPCTATSQMPPPLLFLSGCRVVPAGEDTTLPRHPSTLRTGMGGLKSAPASPLRAQVPTRTKNQGRGLSLLSPGSLLVSTLGRGPKIPDPSSGQLKPLGKCLQLFFEFVQEVLQNKEPWGYSRHMLQLGEPLLSLSWETHGAVDKQPAELSRSPVTLLCPDVGGGALETLPHDIFPEIRVFGAGRQVEQAGTVPAGVTPACWVIHPGTARPASCCGSGTQPCLSQATGPLSSVLMGRVLLEGQQLLRSGGPQLALQLGS